MGVAAAVVSGHGDAIPTTVADETRQKVDNMAESDLFFLAEHARALRARVAAEHEPFVVTGASGVVLAHDNVRLPHPDAFTTPEMDLVGVLALFRTAGGLQTILFRGEVQPRVGQRIDLHSMDSADYEVLEVPDWPER